MTDNKIATNDTGKLLPCPFCGSPSARLALCVPSGRNYYCSSFDCGARYCHLTFEEWNTRAIQKPVATAMRSAEEWRKDWPNSQEYSDLHLRESFIERIQQDALSASKPDASVERLRELVECLVNNKPDDLISDDGYTVYDVWIHDARESLAALDKPVGER